ncbi:hypothetical protein AB751O23_BV_00070, partial [Chlamydiales bacterium SCGC AB-751-O23]
RALEKEPKASFVQGLYINKTGGELSGLRYKQLMYHFFFQEYKEPVYRIIQYLKYIVAPCYGIFRTQNLKKIYDFYVHNPSFQKIDYFDTVTAMLACSFGQYLFVPDFYMIRSLDDRMIHDANDKYDVGVQMGEFAQLTKEEHFSHLVDYLYNDSSIPRKFFDELLEMSCLHASLAINLQSKKLHSLYGLFNRKEGLRVNLEKDFSALSVALKVFGEVSRDLTQDVAQLNRLFSPKLALVKA